METITITNFGGRLTRILNGDLNSGFAKFATSWGYDPFSKPMNLTWMYSPDDIKGAVITDAVLAAKLISDDSTARYVYAIGNSGNLYKIDPTNSSTTDTPLYDTPSVISAIPSVVSGTWQYGADMEYYNGRLQLTSDSKIVGVNLSGSVLGTSSLTAALYHPQVQFLGKLYVGNGNNLVEFDTTNTITNGAKLSPALPTGLYMNDLDVTPDGVYMVISASYLYPTNISAPLNSDRGAPYAVESFQFLWNGVDAGITTSRVLPSFPATALNTFLDKRYYFTNDAFGTALFEGNQKLLTLPQNLTPMPDASTPNGTFLTWAAPEVTGSTINSSTGAGDATFTSLYYFGQLDGENSAGLWRLFRQAPSASNHAWRAPLNMMVNNYSFSRQFVAGWGKHYISVFEYNSGAATNTFHFYRFVLPPAANTAPLLGVYETQTQLFSKRISVPQVRVYTEPTTTNNGFRIDLINSDGTSLYNGTYTYAAGSDITALQGPLERINFNPAVDMGFAVGIRITNTGTSNMTIKKVEIDWHPEGK